MDDGTEQSDSDIGHVGQSVFGWAVFLVLLVGIGLFSWRVWFYYDKLRRGEVVQLPQYRGQLTSSPEGKLTLTKIFVDRNLVETTGRPSLGPDSGAKLTIVEFGDFDCPYSKTVSAAVRSVMFKHTDKVRFIYRDYPLVDIHPTAQIKAIAAECAYEQGKFWPYHDKLYANVQSKQVADLVAFAKELGLNAVQFERCLTDGRYDQKIKDDAAAAVAAGVTGTPTFFFNGEQVAGAIPENVFENIVVRLLQ